jgi:hypothetical protein
MANKAPKPHSRRIPSEIWTDEKFSSLTSIQKLIALYCITGQSNRIGIFKLDPNKAAEDIGLLAELEDLADSDKDSK